MKIQLVVQYNNSDTGDRDIQEISLESNDETLEMLATTCDSRPTAQSFTLFFKYMYDNPSMDGSKVGVLYHDLWTIFSSWAFEKLGWGDVTVDINSVSIDDKPLRLDLDMIDNTQFSLQLSRDGFMYCYA